jgi:urease accessory protein
MQIISHPIEAPDASLPEVALMVERLTAAQRSWRGKAADGMEFEFALAKPLQHGAAFWQTSAARYVIEQHPEPVVAVSLDLAPSAAAGIGWAIGNLHLELSAEPARLLAADTPAVRELLGRLKVPYTRTTTVFRPGRFARGLQTSHELGSSHTH